MGNMGNERMPTPEEAPKGRDEAIKVSKKHAVLKNSMREFPSEMEHAMFGMGCFWGAERKFWQLNGVFSTQVGYAAGYTPNPTYREVCAGQTGHNEVVRVIFDPAKVTYEEMLQTFWESHNPTQGMQQGNDRGSQYRSGIYTYSGAQKQLAEATKVAYEAKLQGQGYSKITTEIRDAPPFYYAEDYHQQYLHKNAGGYCGLGGTGVACPRGLGPKAGKKDEL